MLISELLVNLQPVHLVGVSVNVIWVTSQGPCGEHVHQCEMLGILQYMVKLVIKTKIFSPVARQPALLWQPFCALLVRVVIPMLIPSMNLIELPSTELLQIFI